ncbi:MAG: excinuclease ABC subunit UvrB [Spirochaetes bacterium]|nr:excinuclease ABC subunit UvrB [Spirochaetota bacterium]
MEFKVQSKFQPAGDQPTAIKQLADGIKKKHRYQTLLGVTGSGKTFTMAKVIEEVQKPTLVISHNKTLAAQLYREFKEFFPKNAVEYFVSYYDYYQPEAYVPAKDLYIEKDSSINDEIDRLRLKATSSIMERNDVIIVATVSCIYGLGSPEDYKKMLLLLEKNQVIDRDKILEKLIKIQYERNDFDFGRGTFRVRGDTIEIYPAYSEEAVRIEMFGDTIEALSRIHPVSNKTTTSLEKLAIYPAKHFVTPRQKIDQAIKAIRQELEEQHQYLESKNLLVEAQRLFSRTNYDIEMLKEVGYCTGIENYNRHLTGRKAGERPACLLDYFDSDFIMFIDESHVTVPQLHGMYAGDRSRKEVLVKFGFRLPSALDNRPLFFDEFLKMTHQIIFVSATPREYEIQSSQTIAEQLIRPTGLVDPEIIVKPIENQIDDLITEIHKTIKHKERVLVTTLTKRMSEDLANYLATLNINVRYLHSEIETIERVELLRDLRAGHFDVLVGINLLREGLDLPEVSLVAILDADKEGFLRSDISLIQIMGRAARNIRGKVILYADKITKSIHKAISEASRRRKIQIAYNKKHRIIPKSIEKEVVDILERKKEESLDFDNIIGQAKEKVRSYKMSDAQFKTKLISELEKKMFDLANNLEFEKAAYIRDFIKNMDDPENKGFKDPGIQGFK